jgi:hypothetical protein
MASTFNMFDREIKLATAELEPAAIQRALAAFARESVADVISKGQAPARYERVVNNRTGVSEDAVQLPGPIVYLFTNWALAIGTAIAELEKRSPRRSGKYAGSWLVVSGNRVVTDYQSIPAGAEVIILNYRPYTRKIEVGANRTGKRHVDLSKAAFNRRFDQAFRAETRFVNAASGLHPSIPYLLKRSQGKRKDRQAGLPITYPAMVINAL